MKSAEKRQRAETDDPCVQYCALPYRVADGGHLEVLLITSRESHHWILPKGWPMKGLEPHRAAEVEAFEEAGAVGRPDARVIGEYRYFKRLTSSFALCDVKVFGLEVDHLEATWPEDHQRQRRWFAPEDAAELIDVPGLSSVIQSFVPAPPEGDAD